jgi:hypothetical protein
MRKRFLIFVVKFKKELCETAANASYAIHR